MEIRVGRPFLGILFLTLCTHHISALMPPPVFMMAWNLFETDNPEEDKKKLELYGQVLPQGGFLLLESGWLEWAYKNRAQVFSDTSFKDLLSLFFTKQNSLILLPTQHNPVEKFNPEQLGMLVGLLLQGDEKTLTPEVLRLFPKKISNKLTHYGGKRFFEIFFEAYRETLTPQFPFSPYALFYVLHAFFILKFDSEKDLFDYFRGIKRIFPHLDELKKSKDTSAEKKPHVSFKDYLERASSPKSSREIQEFFNEIIYYLYTKNALPPYISTQNLSCSGAPPINFSDCSESVIRMIAVLVLWNFKTREIDLSLLAEKQAQSMPKKFKDFFLSEKFSSLATTRSQASAQEWASLISDLPGVNYVQEGCEIEPSEENFVKTLATIFGLSKKIKTFKEFGEIISTKDHSVKFRERVPIIGERTFSMEITPTPKEEKSYTFTITINSAVHATFSYPLKLKTFSANTIDTFHIFENLLQKTELVPPSLRNSVEAYVEGGCKTVANMVKNDDLTLLNQVVLYELPLLTKILLNDPLIETGSSSPTLIHTAVSTEQYDIVQALLTHPQTDPNILAECEKDIFMTPLILAIELDLQNIIELFLKNESVDLNKPDSQGKTPLHHAVEKENEPLVQRLLSHKNVAVERVDVSGKTPIDYAIKQKNTLIEKMLQDKLKAQSTEREGSR